MRLSPKRIAPIRSTTPIGLAVLLVGGVGGLLQGLLLSSWLQNNVGRLKTDLVSCCRRCRSLREDRDQELVIASAFLVREGCRNSYRVCPSAMVIAVIGWTLICPASKRQLQAFNLQGAHFDPSNVRLHATERSVIHQHLLPYLPLQPRIIIYGCCEHSMNTSRNTRRAEHGVDCLKASPIVSTRPLLNHTGSLHMLSV